jgi:hypothetical protein
VRELLQLVGHGFATARCPSRRGSGSLSGVAKAITSSLIRGPSAGSSSSFNKKRRSTRLLFTELISPGFVSVRGRARGIASIAEVGKAALRKPRWSRSRASRPREREEDGKSAADGRRSGPVKRLSLTRRRRSRAWRSPHGDRDMERQKQERTPTLAEYAVGRKRGSAARRSP